MTTHSHGRRARSPGRGVVVTTALAFAVLGGTAWPFTIDDAFVVARFARNLAIGCGYAMNCGQTSDGVTGPLALLPGVLATWMAVDASVGLKLSSALGSVAALLAAVSWARRAALGRARAALVAGFGLVSSPLVLWGVAGLETGLATFAVTIAGLATLARGAPEAHRAGIALCALGWLRPELAPFALGIALTVAERDRRAGLVVGAYGLIGWLSPMAFRRVFFDHALPLALAAKPGELGHGVAYATMAVAWTTGVAGVGLAMRGARRWRARGLGYALALHVAGVVVAGGDWMPGFRLLAPVAPLYALLAAGGVVAPTRRRAVRLLGYAACVPALALPALDLAVQIDRGRELARRRAAHAPTIVNALRLHHRVALVDVGYLPYAAGVEVIDLGGITDAEVAYAPGGHLDKRIDERWLQARAPDALLLHAARAPVVDDDDRLIQLDGFPVERRVARMASVRRSFRVAAAFPFAPGYGYVLLARDEPLAARRLRLPRGP